MKQRTYIVGLIIISKGGILLYKLHTYGRVALWAWRLCVDPDQSRQGLNDLNAAAVLDDST